jgi:hypothetical protein
MTLTGRLKCGGDVERIPYCEMEDSVANDLNNWECGNEARYIVRFDDGEVLHVCEEHAEKLWAMDDKYTEGGL